MRKTIALAVLSFLLVMIFAACSSGRNLPQASPDMEGQSPWQKTALWVEQDGKTKPFENGSAIDVGGVTVEFFVAPYPPTREGSIDLFVRDKTTRAPVESGNLRIAFDMYMPHGSIRAEALPTGGGHYLIPYKLVMPGEWRVDITISHGGDTVTLAFIFRVN